MITGGSVPLPVATHPQHHLPVALTPVSTGPPDMTATSVGQDDRAAGPPQRLHLLSPQRREPAQVVQRLTDRPQLVFAWTRGVDVELGAAPTELRDRVAEHGVVERADRQRQPARRGG